MKGILAKRYGDLILDLWSGFYRSIAPVKLRVRNVIALMNLLCCSILTL